MAELFSLGHFAHFDFMRPVMKRALIAAGVTAVVCGVVSPPDLSMQIMAAVFSFAVIVAILFICFRLVPVPSWSSAKQHTFIWLIAVVTGVVCVPLADRFLFR